MNYTVRDAQALLKEIERYCPLERIALELEKSRYTIDRWIKGQGKPSRGDFELLKTLKARLATENI